MSQQILLDWDDVIATEEWQDDYQLLLDSVQRGIGNENIVDSSSPYIWVIAYLGASFRYYCRHLAQFKDLDSTPYLQQMAEELGFNVKVSSAFPMLQLLRENKFFYGIKGTEACFTFLGRLFGTRIEIDYPAELIFTLDTERSCLDGSVSAGGSPLPFDESSLAYIRDGIYWAEFVYVLNILDGQQVTQFMDFLALLDFVHPAGTQRFTNWFFSWENTNSADMIPTIPYGGSMITNTGIVNELGYPGLDDGFILDSDGSSGNNPGSFLDNLNSDPQWYNATITEWVNYSTDSIFSRMWTDQCDEEGTGVGLMHIFIPGKPWATFSRYIGQPDGTYKHVYPDNDAICYENVTTNVGLLDYTISELSNFSIRELKLAALDKDQQNMRGMWQPEMLNCSIVLNP